MATQAAVGATAPSYIPLSLPNSYQSMERVEFSWAYPTGGNAYAGAQRVDQAGLLLSLLLTFSGTVTVPSGAATPTLHPEFPWCLFQRVQFEGMNPGSSIDLPGYALNQFERIREADFVPSYSFTAPTAGNSAPLTFDLQVPVCVRHGDMVGEWSDLLGALYTGDQQLQARLNILWGNESNLFTNQSSALAVLTGTLTVTSYKLDTPSPSQDPALLYITSWLHQFKSEVENLAITAAGSLASLPDLPTAQARAYLRVLDIIRNTVSSNVIPVAHLINDYTWSVQDTVEMVKQIPEQVILSEQARRYILGLPAGSYCWDRAAGNRRDGWFPVGNINLLRGRPTIVIPSGVTLSGAYLDRYSEIVVPSALVQKYTQAASPAVLQAAAQIAAAAAGPGQSTS